MTYETELSIALADLDRSGSVPCPTVVGWQGICRERFLRERAPDFLQELLAGRAGLLTRACRCELLERAIAGDVRARMDLTSVDGTRFQVDFDFWQDETLVARGSQELQYTTKEDSDTIEPIALPDSLGLAPQGLGLKDRAPLVEPGSHSRVSDDSWTIEHVHASTFQESNVVGNVYFAAYFRWFVRARERLLADWRPDVFEALRDGRSECRTITCACRYETELYPMEAVLIRAIGARLDEDRYNVEFAVLSADRSDTPAARGNEQFRILRVER